MRGSVAVRMAVLAMAAALACLLAPSAQATFPGANGKIAFYNSANPAGVWTMNADGMGQTMLRAGYRPAWSPDGSDLLFVRENDIRRMPADGSSETALLNASGFDEVGNGFTWDDPAWSPDATQIAASYVGGTHDSYTGRVRSAAADGSGIQFVANGHSPSWHPDGSLISFIGENGAGDAEGLHTVQPSGADERSIVENPYSRQPDYSPDGAQIVFSTYLGADPDLEIVVASSAESCPLPPLPCSSAQQPVRLTDNTFDDSDPVWSPDGTKIAFVSNRDGDFNDEIYTMNVDGTNQTRITNDPATIQREPSWQPIPINSYPRPKGAGPVRASLVPAFAQCASANRTHGPPLAFGSCHPPAQASDELTVGTPDANGKVARSQSFVKLGVQVGIPATPADEADVHIRADINDVYTQAGLADYAGELRARFSLRITDKRNVPDPGGEGAGTTSDFSYEFTVPCGATADPGTGGACALDTTADALAPGAIAEGKRTIWQMGRVEVDDGGADADADTTGDNTPFLTQGLFVP